MTKDDTHRDIFQELIDADIPETDIHKKWYEGWSMEQILEHFYAEGLIG